MPLKSEQQSFRIYSDEECGKLDTECRGFLLFLEQMGVLDHATREMVIDRVMALDSEEVDLEQLKWVILMVLFNQPGQEPPWPGWKIWCWMKWSASCTECTSFGYHAAQAGIFSGCKL